jgi:hypothetical protein
MLCVADEPQVRWALGHAAWCEPRAYLGLRRRVLSNEWRARRCTMTRRGCRHVLIAGYCADGLPLIEDKPYSACFKLLREPPGVDAASVCRPSV